MAYKPRNACRVMWETIKNDGFTEKPPLTKSFMEGEAPFYSFTVYDKRGIGTYININIDDFVGLLKKSDQAKAREYFGITDEQWSRWEPTAGKTPREQQAELEKSVSKSTASDGAASDCTHEMNRYPSRESDNKKERRLARWCNQQRRAFQRGELSAEKVQLLETLPDWTWEVEGGLRETKGDGNGES